MADDDKKGALKPANYYFYGRAPYPGILIGVVCAAIFAVSGSLAIIIMVSMSNDVDNEKRHLKMQEQYYNITIKEGTNLDQAMTAVEKYSTSNSQDRHDLFIDRASNKKRGAGGFPISHIHEIQDMLRMDKSKDEIRQYLSHYQEPGLNLQIEREEALKNFLTAFIPVEGVDASETDLNVELTRMGNVNQDRIPASVRMMMKQEEGFTGDAASLLVQKEDEVKNFKGKIDLRVAEMKKILETVGEKYQGQLDIFKQLRTDLDDKRKTHGENFWKEIEGVANSWKEFENLSRQHINNVRTRNEILTERQKVLDELKKLYDSRKVDVDEWLTPLDLVDGRVLAANRDLDFVVIDLGRSDGLRIGQGFDVFRMKGEIRQSNKGRIEVKHLDDHVSICKIISMKDLDPISVGDSVSNSRLDEPFDKKVRPVYILMGSFKSRPSKPLATALLEHSGGVITTKMNERTNYLVAGSGLKMEVLRNANSMGIRVIRAKDLPQHLGYDNITLREFEQRLQRMDKLANRYRR